MSLQCATTPSTSSAVYGLNGACVTGLASRSRSSSPTSTSRCSASNRRSTARWRALLRADMSVVGSRWLRGRHSADPAEVGAVPGVHLDLGPSLEEQRHLELGPG